MVRGDAPGGRRPRAGHSDAVRAGLQEAGTRERRLLLELEVAIDHADAGRVESDLRDRGIVVLDTTYAALVTLRLGVAPAHEPELHAALAALSAGTLAASAVGRRWVDIG
ncbi:MAG: DUF1949 domain-containing protein [Nocardioides sp.]